MVGGRTVDSFEFETLKPEDKDDGERVEVEIGVAAEDVDRLMDEFYLLMAKVRGIQTDDPQEAQEKLEEQIQRIDLNPAMRDYLLNRFTKEAVKQLDIETALPPGVHAETIPVRGEGYAYSINLVRPPKMSLSSYEPVHIAKREIIVTDQDIDEQLEVAARQTLTYELGDHPDVREGDFALMDVEMTVNGQKLNRLSGSRIRIEVAKGQVPDGFIEGVIGMVPGDTRTFKFDVKLPLAKEGDDPFDHYEAQVTMWEVQKQVFPRVDNAWVKTNVPQFGDLAGFRAYIRQEIEIQKKKVDRQTFVNDVREALEKRLVGKIPDIMYEEAKDSFMRVMLEKLDEQEMSLEDYCEQHDIDKATFNMNTFMQASSYLRQNLALDELAKEKGFEATDDEIRKARQEINPAMARMSDQEFEDRGYRKSLAESLRRKKALAWLMETVVID